MQKPSFFTSVKAGAIGMVKGALMLGAIGLIGGAAGGAIIGALATGGAGALATAALGAAVFGQLGISIGSFVGAVTGVVQSRDAEAVSGQDVMNLANISFAKGVEVGQSQSVSAHSKQEVKEAAVNFQDNLAKEKASTVIAR